MMLGAVSRVALPALALYALEAPMLRAGIIPVLQDRSVLLRVFGPPGHSHDPECGIFFNCINFDETRAASGFGLFDESLSVPGHGRAQQTSSISPLLVRAVGFTEAATSRVDPFTYVDAISDFDLKFEVVSTETWRLNVNMQPVHCPCLGPSFSLIGPGVSIVLDEDLVTDPFNIDQLVKLTPGSYRLQVASVVNAQEEAISMKYDMTFQSTIPEPGTVWLLIMSSAVIGTRALYRLRAPRGNCASGQYPLV
jgi:hypothetical protein